MKALPYKENTFDCTINFLYYKIRLPLHLGVRLKKVKPKLEIKEKKKKEERTTLIEHKETNHAHRLITVCPKS